MAGVIDLLVIGGGSGGIACARRAAALGKRVVLVESARLGGTCVNVGCVPKKVMWHAAEDFGRLAHAHEYGVDVHSATPPTFALARLKASRDAYVARLNGIYAANLKSAGVRVIEGRATFVGPRRVRVSGDHEEELTADNVLIATGGRPFVPPIPGANLAITSDGFFELDAVPRRVAVIGAGYIAVELAGILQALGSSVTLLVRGAEGEGLLRGFDADIRASLAAALKRAGVAVEYGFEPARIDEVGLSQAAAPAIGRPAIARELTITAVAAAAASPRVAGPFDVVIAATGRAPHTDGLGLPAAGVATASAGGRAHGDRVVVDAWQATSAPGVFALGDVSSAPHFNLTPVAIAAGRLLADRLFRPPAPHAPPPPLAPAASGGGDARLRLEYTDVPTVVFTHPPIGAVGATQAEAEAAHGSARVRVFVSRFNPLYYGVLAAKVPALMKLVTLLPPDVEPGSPDADDPARLRVIGVHVHGDGADEMLQGFAVAVRLGASKADFDATVAIHPTAAEELVTMPPWRPRPALPLI